jgi:hypothetical protein
LAKILSATSATNDIVGRRLPQIAYIPLILIVHHIPIQQLKTNPTEQKAQTARSSIAFIPLDTNSRRRRIVFPNTLETAAAFILLTIFLDRAPTACLLFPSSRDFN